MSSKDTNSRQGPRFGAKNPFETRKTKSGKPGFATINPFASLEDSRSDPSQEMDVPAVFPDFHGEENKDFALTDDFKNAMAEANAQEKDDMYDDSDLDDAGEDALLSEMKEDDENFIGDSEGPPKPRDQAADQEKLLAKIIEDVAATDVNKDTPEVHKDPSLD